LAKIQVNNIVFKENVSRLQHSFVIEKQTNKKILETICDFALKNDKIIKINKLFIIILINFLFKLFYQRHFFSVEVLLTNIL
jgi:hypothetical protein